MTYRQNSLANPATEAKHLVTAAEALKLIRASSNRQFYVCGYTAAPTANEPDSKEFHLYMSIKVTKPDALRHVKDVWDGRFKTDALVKLHVTQHCFFIG